MSHITRIVVVAAVLAGGLTLAAPLHASPFQGTQPAAGAQPGALAWSAGPWSGDWLLNLLQRIWPKNGATLDPSGGSSAAPPANPTAGGTLDPSGGSGAAHHRLPTGRDSHSLSN